MTAAELDEIRRRDANVVVYVDKYGGEFVMNRDGRIHGQHAIMDRRRLLKHVADLEQQLRRAADPVLAHPGRALGIGGM